jgi:hypothetical protein
MSIPEGWQLVPIEPTLAMCTAYEQAMKNYIGSLPASIRRKRRMYPGGYLVPEAIKLKIRWQAMLKAAPNCSGERKGEA